MPEITEKIELVDLDKAEERATRMLDGGTFNREVVGRDVLSMVREIRMWRQKHADVVMGAR